MSGFKLRRYAMHPVGSEEDITLCDECMEDEFRVVETSSSPYHYGEALEIVNEEGEEYYWIEDKSDPEDTCEYCRHSEESKREEYDDWHHDEWCDVSPREACDECMRARRRRC